MDLRTSHAETADAGRLRSRGGHNGGKLGSLAAVDGVARVSAPAAVCGALLLPPGDARAPRWVARLSLPNPAYVAWLRHGRGRSPVQTVSPIVIQTGGPWKGGAAVPRMAPDAGEGADRMVAPLAEPVALAATLRPYQVAAVAAAAAAGGGLIVAPTGSGKTVIGCALMAHHETPALILVHTRDLADQWVERVRDFLNVEAEIVGYGKPAPSVGARVVIASMQTVGRWDWWDVHQWGQRFGLVIVDEAHHGPCVTYLRILAGLPGRHRYGLTATPDRADGLTPWMHWTIGPVVAEVDHREIEAAGAVLRPRIRWWHAPPVDLEGMEPHERAAALADDDGRNGGLMAEARILVAEGHVVLLLVRLVEHARRIADGLAVAGCDAVALVGDVKPAARAEIIDRMRAGRVQVVVATSLADEGLDVPRLDAVIMTEPSRNVGRVLQRIGRVLRPHPDGRPPIVVDVVDPFGPYLGAAKAREATYRGRGWLS